METSVNCFMFNTLFHFHFYPSVAPFSLSLEERDCGRSGAKRLGFTQVTRYVCYMLHVTGYDPALAKPRFSSSAAAGTSNN